MSFPHDAAVDVPGVGSVGAEDVLAEVVVLEVVDDDAVADVDVDGVGAVSIASTSSSSSSFFILKEDRLKIETQKCRILFGLFGYCDSC